MNGQRPLLVVIDDEQGILDVVGRFAQRAGYETATFSSGREAIAQLQTRRADLVLVDLRMPDVGGLDVLRAIHDNDPRCQAVLTLPLPYQRCVGGTIDCRFMAPWSRHQGAELNPIVSLHHLGPYLLEQFHPGEPDGLRHADFALLFKLC